MRAKVRATNAVIMIMETTSPVPDLPKIYSGYAAPLIFSLYDTAFAMKSLRIDCALK